jgi:biopolymer transport protein ExbB
MQFVLDIFDYLERGGPLMGPILLVSLLLWCLILFQLRQLWRVSRHDVGLTEALATISGRKPPERLAGTPLCRLVERFVRARGPCRRDNAALLEVLVAREEAYLGRYINYIFVLATIAPLLGLLGTVQGMISTFDVISVFGTGNPRALANGISEALITTQSGLFVSIPGLFMAGFLRRRVARLGQRLEEFKAGVLQVL